MKAFQRSMPALFLLVKCGLGAASRQPVATAVGPVGMTVSDGKCRRIRAGA